LASAIIVDGLEKSYGTKKAVNCISFTVNQGEIFSLLGPNGAGKTTTVEILEGLRERDAGRIEVLGMDPWRQGYELHKRIGVIPQGFSFFDKQKPVEAIQYYAELFGLKVNAQEILEKVILEEAADTVFEDLSGGQRQKLGLALALVNDPEVLFLDEPTTGLDPQARRNLWNVIQGLKEGGRTVLLTTHYLEEAELLADRVAIMNHGEIITSGTPEEIVRKYGSGKKIVIKGGEGLYSAIIKSGISGAFRNDDGEVSVPVRDKRDIISLVTSIESAGVTWGDIRTEEDSLEDVFVKLVGGTMDEGELKSESVSEGKSP
jgi:ABC-2 type transport system ATP-binding protein